MHFNDLDAAALNVVKKNIGQTWRNCRLTQKDYLSVLNQDYDLIFLDPPYDSDFGARAIDQIQHGLIVFETDREFNHAQIVEARHYGRAWIYLIQK